MKKGSDSVTFSPFLSKDREKGKTVEIFSPFLFRD